MRELTSHEQPELLQPGGRRDVIAQVLRWLTSAAMASGRLRVDRLASPSSHTSSYTRTWTSDKLRMFAAVCGSLGRSHDGFHAASEFFDRVHLETGADGLVLDGSGLGCCRTSTYSTVQTDEEDACREGLQLEHVER
jgi:hypothetical protein